MLIVIDDAWKEDDTHPFLRGSPHCARLITTRDSGTLPRGTVEQPVDQMQGAEAVALLRAGLPAGEDEALRLLAGRLGEWPLLLKLANSAMVDRVVHSRAPLRDTVVHTVRLLDKRGLTAFDPRETEGRRDAVASTLALSLDRLHTKEQNLLCELAVFPEDVPIPVGTVNMLWRESASFEDYDTNELLQRLLRLSLLLRLDLDSRFLQLHDVIRTWLRERIGSDLTQVERRLAKQRRSP
jgi:hypothetical protein